MVRALRHFSRLYSLAVGLRRHGALSALEVIALVPPGLTLLLKILTFYIPVRRDAAETPGRRLAAALSRMGPAYIKLGQTLATRPDVVSRPLAEGLATLQDRLPPFSYKAVCRIIADELGGPVEDHFDSFEVEPVAAASIAQVHRAVTKEGRPVAVKVLRPGIEGRFRRDLALFDWLAGLGEQYSVEGRRLRLKDVVAKVRETAAREMDLRLEAAAGAELADNMTAESGYRVPSFDWHLTSRRVLVLDWVSGIRLGDRAGLSAAGFDLPALASRVVRVFLKQAMRDGYFHADLHQGNLLVEADGTIAAIDFGIMGRLSVKERRFLAEILYGFISRDYQRVAQIHFDAGYVPADQSVEAFAQAMRAIADPIMDLPVEQISAGRLLAQLFATTERFSMQTQPQLLLLQRAMVMAEGLALHLDANANMWEISRPVLEDWMRDNLSPEARLSEALGRIPYLTSRLPMLIERWLEPAPPAPVTVPAAHTVRGRAFWPFLAGLALGTLAVLLAGL
ncbi:2-polyprenylphenol 6-hydroxylase [Eilatimonas milleporae]|uniref:2-octaprenylphenol hydroxylase n=1 Tax=Eilatimonas milleporae TaxID=911205 RepID=A0A3M0BSZ4_9PROT|nr:2-polyprenylphenol 6-hydroxylase [Eilatimonas milleporae]RMB00641.1 2-octaprenylphenol hydroxylase [Eilatimonas milleporae]